MAISKRRFAGIAAGAGLWLTLRAGRVLAQIDKRPAGPDSGGVAPASEPYPGGYVVKAPPVPAGVPAVVRVQEGLLQGVEANGVRYFRAVPFAQAPIGPLRFQPPKPPHAWDGIRLATTNPPASLQPNFVAEAPTSEDCLYLNIWAPATPGPHPVFVYIHGGGNTTGYSLEHRVDGASFARDGVVCVNIGYRLGALGFLELGGLLGSQFEGSGNNGLRDQQMALLWVQRNIARFQGDPKRVTIGGQSAGGFNVCSLTASPLSTGLFRGAISQSGSGHGIATMETARANAERFAAAVTALGGRPGELQSMSVDLILAAQSAAMQTGSHNGVIDGKVLLEHPYDAMRLGRGRDVALMMGSNRDEMRLFGPSPNPATFSVDKKRAFARYRTVYPGLSETELADSFASDQMFGAPTAIYADNHAAAGGNSYVYRWDWTASTGKFKGLAIHGIETPFVWNNPASLAFRYIEPDSKIRERAAVIHQLWVSFIRDGRPSSAQLPKWPRWETSRRNYMVMGERFHVEQLPNVGMSLWSGLLPA